MSTPSFPCKNAHGRDVDVGSLQVLDRGFGRLLVRQECFKLVDWSMAEFINIDRGTFGHIVHLQAASSISNSEVTEAYAAMDERRAIKFLRPYRRLQGPSQATMSTPGQVIRLGPWPR